MNDELQQKALEWASALETALADAIPAAGELGMTLGQIGAIQTIVVGLVCLFGLVMTLIVTYFGGRKLHTWIQENRDNEPAYLLLLFLVIPIGAFMEEAFSRLFNIYAWVGMWSPEVYIAAQLLELV